MVVASTTLGDAGGVVLSLPPSLSKAITAGGIPIGPFALVPKFFGPIEGLVSRLPQGGGGLSFAMKW